ncbi:MAG: aminopeptidase [Sumerlaeia bacterium]
MTTDPRDVQLAEMLVAYSVAAKPGELVFIQCIGADTLALGHACQKAAAAAGAAPFLHFQDPAAHREYLMTCDDEGLRRLARFETVQMKDADCYIGIRGAGNIFETSDVPQDRMKAYMDIVYKPVHLQHRVKGTRWCVLRYPNPGMAQLAQKSTAAFAGFYYDVCLVDYARMAKAVQPLKDLMLRTDRLEITGPGETNLTMSIKDIGVVPCCGNHNIPDGECFSAPVRDSVNGVIQFNTPTVYQGMPFDNVRLEFREGKVVDARAANPKQTKALNEILDRDEGARYLGEVSVGFNPAVREAMRDILFDEKIGGSLHMALGECYDEAPNGNQSGIHWDLVLIQREEYGGGEIRFDGRLIRKDGVFVVDELKGLNPEAFGK